MQTVDIIEDRRVVTNDFEEKIRWITHIWTHTLFLKWFATALLPLEFTRRTRSGWSVRIHTNRIEISLGPDPLSDVELATIVGVAGRGQGLIHGTVSKATYDSGTVTITAAALLVVNEQRAKEFWDIMAAIRMPGAAPPNVAGWTPQLWAKELP